MRPVIHILKVFEVPAICIFQTLSYSLLKCSRANQTDNIGYVSHASKHLLMEGRLLHYLPGIFLPSVRSWQYLIRQHQQDYSNKDPPHLELLRLIGELLVVLQDRGEDVVAEL